MKERDLNKTLFQADAYEKAEERVNNLITQLHDCHLVIKQLQDERRAAEERVKRNEQDCLDLGRCYREALEEYKKVKERAGRAEAQEAELRTLIEEFVELCTSSETEDPIEVGCHCTDAGERTVKCVWCRAREVLSRSRPTILDRLAELEAENAELKNKTSRKQRPKLSPEQLSEVRRRAGKIGGAARAKALTPEQRSELGRRGAAARWKKKPEALEGGGE